MLSCAYAGPGLACCTEWVNGGPEMRPLFPLCWNMALLGTLTVPLKAGHNSAPPLLGNRFPCSPVLSPVPVPGPSSTDGEVFREVCRIRVEAPLVDLDVLFYTKILIMVVHKCSCATPSYELRWLLNSPPDQRYVVLIKGGWGGHSLGGLPSLFLSAWRKKERGKKASIDFLSCKRFPF